MFRYIAFGWISTSEGQASSARHLEASLQPREGWSRVFSSQGLRVYAAGSAFGVNEVHTFPSRRGVVLGRLFRRAEVDGSGNREFQISDDEDDCIVRTDGRALIDHFWGRWIAFLPSWTGESRVLRDPGGALPCYQLQLDGITITFSSLEDVLALLGMPAPPVNWDAVMAALVFRQLGGRETALAGVTQVLAGELTPCTPSSSEPKLLWSAANIARKPVDPAQEVAAAMLRDTTTQCVSAWTSCHDTILLRLSGGLDSAILLGSMLKEHSAARIACLNYHSPGSDSDEREYARIAAARVGCRLIERRRDDDFHLSEVLHPAREPVPSNHLGRLGSDRIDAQTAQAVGARVMFTGAAGDQLFQEIRNTWPAADYLQLRGVDRGFPQAVLDAARLGRVSFWRALQLAIRDRLAKHDPVSGIGQYISLVPSAIVAETLRQAPRFVHPELLGASDLPIGKLFQVRNLICPVEYYNPYRRDTSPEAVHPLISQPLLELCLTLPTYLLTRGGKGRALAREAFADRIPPEIARRRSKGGIDEHATAVLQRSLPLAREILLDGQLIRRGLLDRERVEAALTGRPSTSGAYVAEVHCCFAAEAWLSQVLGSTAATMP
ncbi:asparagine synthase-related protein [Roseateles sp. LYH14W]|uniref:asparagine synthase (glutamine-hydrolyzing) n=1 Tax=Pelomonas parva TaxID=3299032 RepID=A0ABW7F680_9BURK